MQFKSVFAVSAAIFVAALGANGCSGGGVTKTDAGDSGGKDGNVKPDTGGGDSGVCGSGLACEQCDVSGYSVTTQSAPSATANACTQTQITGFAAACFGTAATQTTCNTWQTANTPDAGGGNCLNCLFTLQSTSAWGFLVCTSSSCSINTPGCVDLVLHQQAQEKVANGAGSCGDLINASYGCQDYACSTCATTGAPNSDFDNCAKSAVASECKSYVTPIDSPTGPCATLQGDAAPAAANNCFPQSDADIPNMANMFCGNAVP